MPSTHPTPDVPRFLRAAAASLAVALLLGGCIINDRRSAGTILDDQSMEFRIVDAIYSRPEIDNQDHIKVEVYNRVALLVGEASTEANRATAERVAGEVDYVERVVNELAVTQRDGAGGRAENTWLTWKVNAALTRENPVPGIDSTRIKVVTARNTVYLMGVVSRAEGDAVAEVARNVGGVEKVVKVFSYTD
jgi:osmotically-inducible protein OsmY